LVPEQPQRHQQKEQHRRGVNHAHYPMEANMLIGPMPDQGQCHQQQAQMQHHVAMMQPIKTPHGHPQHAVAANQHLQANQSLPQQTVMPARPDVLRAHQKSQVEARQQPVATAQPMAKLRWPTSTSKGLAVAQLFHSRVALASIKNVRSNSLDLVTSTDDEGIRQGQNTCLRIPLNCQLPEEIPASLTEEQIAPLRNFLHVWRPQRHTPQPAGRKQCNVTIQVEVERASEIQQLVLPEEDLKRCKSFVESMTPPS